MNYNGHFHYNEDICHTGSLMCFKSLVESIHPWFQSLMGFIDDKENIEYCQPCPSNLDVWDNEPK